MQWRNQHFGYHCIDAKFRQTSEEILEEKLFSEKIYVVYSKLVGVKIG